MYRDCIAPAIYSDSCATMDLESGVIGTSFRAIPQSMKIINQFCSYAEATMNDEVNLLQETYISYILLWVTFVIFKIFIYLIDCEIAMKFSLNPCSDA